MSSPIPVREADVQRAILDWLAAERIWHIRLNTGAMAGQHKGKRWFVRFGRPGMADILAMPIKREGWMHQCRYFRDGHHINVSYPQAVWIEVKGPKGKLSEDQERFGTEVSAAGMRYVVARSLDDVIAVLK